MNMYKLYQIASIITDDKRKKKELYHNYVIIEFQYKDNNNNFFISRDLYTDSIDYKLYKVIMKTNKELYLIFRVKTAWVVNDEYLYFITSYGDVYSLRDLKQSISKENIKKYKI